MLFRKPVTVISFVLCLCLMLPLMLSAQETVVVRAEKIYTVTKGIIDNGMILIKDGKITDIGKNIRVPSGAREITGKVAIPGLVDMHTHLGVYSIPLVDENSDGNEMTNPVTPQVRALDSFNFDDPAIAVGRAGGVTTIVSRPGSGNVIGGTSVAVKLKDASPDEMVLKEICDLKMAMEGNPIGVYGRRNQSPGTLMAVYHLAEKAFLDAQEYLEKLEKYEKDKADGEDVTAPKRDLGMEAIVKALKREIPVHIHVATASEIVSAIRFADSFNLRLSICHGYYAHLLVDEYADRTDIHWNIGPPMFFNYYLDALTFKNNPAILAEAGYNVSLQTDALGGAQQNLRHLATLCVRYGMKEADALKAITLTPAEAVDLGGRIGSLEKGKDADIVLLNGNPFELLTSIEKVIIDGKTEYTRDRQFSSDINLKQEQAESKLELSSALKEAKKIAIKGGTVFTMAGEPLTNGIVLIENGKVKRVGNDFSVPRGYEVVDAGDFTVMPGLIAPRSYVGIGSNWRRQSHIDEMSSSVVPALEVKNAVEPHAPPFTYARELGVTTAMVTPGNRNVIGGQSAVLKTTGIVVDKMIVKNKAVMVVGLGRSAKRDGKMPSTRMGIAALLRETLVKAQEYMKKMESDKDNKNGKKDLDMEALIPVLKGEMPVLIHCERRDDILTALRITDEFGLKVILDGATDAYKVVDEIKKRNIPVILENLFRGAGEIEDKGFNPENPAILSRAGVTVAFSPAISSSVFVPGAGEPGGDLLEIAAYNVRNGMTVEAALRAVTIDAARIIGMENRVGSLEAGKDADILILKGHPLKTNSIPEAVFIDGKLVYQRKENARLK